MATYIYIYYGLVSTYTSEPLLPSLPPDYIINNKAYLPFI